MWFKRKIQTVAELEAIKTGIMNTAQEIAYGGLKGGYMNFSDVKRIEELNIKIELTKLKEGKNA